MDSDQPQPDPPSAAESGAAAELPAHLKAGLSETEGELAAFDLEAAERRAEEVLASGTTLPHSDLLRFYDRLREKMLETVERHAGRLPEDAVKALLLVPDVFILLVRLMLDKEVPTKARVLIGGALAYFISPFDLLPEALLGGIGYLDDLVLAVAVLTQVFTGDLEPFARKHWSGPQDFRQALHDVTGAAHRLLGHNLYHRLRNLLARRGIHLEEREKPGPPGK
jgi:uncharacterized membrane protein YkvA (DUF1232 family)